MSVFRFDKAIDMARKVKVFLNSTSRMARGVASDAGRREKLMIEREKKLRDEVRSKGKKRRMKARLELIQLKNERRAAKQQVDGAQTGALPDFVIIGTGRCGTTSLYRFLTQHPYVQPAAKKELHYFDVLFDEGTEWYRQRFPAPRWKDGRRTITGEATPTYIHRPLVPERMAKVIPQARLIALLRNPVDRTYSAYHHRVRDDRETRTFEEAIEVDLEDGSLRYLSKGIYVDNLVRWSEFFVDEQMLVIKSEDYYERPVGTVKDVLNFIGLPEWEPPASEKSYKKYHYPKVNPATKRRLEEYFEPHNKRLYDYLGVDFGW